MLRHWLFAQFRFGCFQILALKVWRHSCRIKQTYFPVSLHKVNCWCQEDFDVFFCDLRWKKLSSFGWVLSSCFLFLLWGSERKTGEHIINNLTVKLNCGSKKRATLEQRVLPEGKTTCGSISKPTHTLVYNHKWIVLANSISSNKRNKTLVGTGIIASTFTNKYKIIHS